MNRFEGLYSFKDACKILGLNESTLRKAVEIGKIVEGEDCKKFGNSWVITIEALKREYPEKCKEAGL